MSNNIQTDSSEIISFDKPSTTQSWSEISEETYSSEIISKNPKSSSETEFVIEIDENMEKIARRFKQLKKTKEAIKMMDAFMASVIGSIVQNGFSHEFEKSLDKLLIECSVKDIKQSLMRKLNYEDSFHYYHSSQFAHLEGNIERINDKYRHLVAAHFELLMKYFKIY